MALLQIWGRRHFSFLEILESRNRVNDALEQRG